ncbi:hypothetical protein R1sor_016663 [Riccia sorocarpa]|uniref:Uncharacterized protein n=1 Tax=Riccia sorocarpa TaxID=122646 RepID=A0ABD3HJP6_9MARC
MDKDLDGLLAGIFVRGSTRVRRVQRLRRGEEWKDLRCGKPSQAKLTVGKQAAKGIKAKSIEGKERPMRGKLGLRLMVEVVLLKLLRGEVRGR